MSLRVPFFKRSPFRGHIPQRQHFSLLEAVMLRALHIPRIRPTVGHVRSLLLLVLIAFWVGVVCAVKHIWG